MEIKFGNKDIVNESVSKTSVMDNVLIHLIRLITWSIIILMSFVIIYIFANGAGVLTWKFLTEPPVNNSTEGGIGPAIFGTVSVVLLMMIMTIPLGIGAAIYIHEYVKDKWYSRLLTLSINMLAGVPPIVVGLFGLGFFVFFIGRRIDTVLNTGLLFGQPIMLWAATTLGVLVLPIIILSTLHTLKSIPDEQRHASLGLGATKWETLSEVILPQARPGILTGIILSVSRAVGETAPVLFLGCTFFLPHLPIAHLNLGFISVPMINPMQQFMHLSFHIFSLATQSSNPTLTLPYQYATATVLLLITLSLNITAIIYRFRFKKILDNLKGR